MTMKVKFHHAGRREWSHLEQDGVTVDFAGREATVRTILSRLGASGPPPASDLGALLAGLPGHFAAVFRGQDWWLAAVDSVRGYQLFHAAAGDVTHLSGCARAVREAVGLSTLDETSLLEFFMAGYVTGPNTLVQGVRQLQAGEALLWRREDGDAPRIVRYYLFHSREFWEGGEQELVEALGKATDAVFDRLVEDLGDRQVWVPLSAGLDSRLVAAKLVERGYSRIETFSYGRPGNHEARHAARVAEALGLPWRFVPTTGAAMRSFHESEERREYWRFCDGLSSVPNPQDILPLTLLRLDGELPSDAVVVNGQSGDFTCGAHIPASLLEPNANLEQLMDIATGKHFALWRDLMTPDNLDRVRIRMRQTLADIDSTPQTPVELAVLHDCWEWQERQAKYVVNGQRIYDFLGLDWRLPLWDLEWMDFWPRVPVAHRLGRGLHKKYLAQWDFRGLFSCSEPVVRHWPGASMALFVLAQGAGLFGRRAKDSWYRYARWFGHYGFQWQGYPLRRFLRDTSQARNVLAQYTETWAEENLGLAGRPL